MNKLSKPTLLFLIFALLLSACGEQPASTNEESQIVAPSGFVCPEPEYDMEVTSKELNIFVWTEYIPDDIIDCFQLIYGVTVNRDEYSSNEEMYAKLNAGGSSYDIAQPTDYWVPLMVRQDLVQPLDHAQLPIIASLDPHYLNLSFDPNNEYSLPYQAGTYGIVVNTDTVKNVPQSWADLWKPEYAGRMIFLDDNRATIGLTLMTLGYDLNSTNPDELEAAKNKLLELVPGIKIFDSDSPKSALIAGDVDLGMTWTGEAYLASRESPAFIYVYPTEGTIRWQDNYVLLKDAPHLDAAYAWLNYSMQGSIFWKMLADFPYTMPSNGALEYAKANQPELYDVYINSPITNTPAEALEKSYYFEDVRDATPLYDQIWVEVKGE
jgi:spermidine/putrescine-binding protein